MAAVHKSQRHPKKEKSGKPKNKASKGGQDGKHVHVSYPDVAKSHARSVSMLLPKIRQLEIQSASVKEKWVVVDNKDAKALALNDSQLSLLKKELSMLRSSARALFGNRPVRFHSPMSFTLTATVTSGVVNSVSTGGNSSILASNLTEFSSFAALFDEVKVHGGFVDFLYANNVVAPLVADSRPVISFDPEINTAATSTDALMQLAQHKTFDVAVSSALDSSSNHHKFHFVVPQGALADPGASFCGDVWQPTSGGLLPNGAIRFYHIGAVVTAIVVGAGQLMLDVSFRCRG